ncbi:T6SS effector BTH_I2691 family protein [Atlantibacter sp.]|uniref:T6SS effector BTH_I2691 family protein n=1 Tax=Atlantibacter sp. TaxID=1903473 RepID=UPI0028A75FC6|nr:T6SS effector BTH_I2691 family protein [Atlantibacter sp.]
MTSDEQIDQYAAASEQAAATPSGCKVCQRTGLPVFPLRVAAVPKALVSSGWKPAVPEQDAGLTGGEFKYALRTLRMGYLYVLLDKRVWQGYQVTAEGYLRQFDALSVPEGDTVEPVSEACREQGHCISASFINLDEKKYREAWLAFSSDPWSREVLADYKSGKRPDSRFRKISLSTLKESPGSVPGALVLDPSLASLKANVAEFATQVFPRTEKVAGEPSGGAHGFYPRLESADALGLKVARLGAQYGCRIAALALDDSVGVIQELNNSRLQIVEARQAYINSPGILHKSLVSRAISGYMESLKKTTEENNQPRYEPAADMPTVWGGEVIAKEQVARETWASQYARLLKSYSETDRAAFAADYEGRLKKWQQRIEATGKDLAACYQSQRWLKLINHDYSPESSAASWAAQFATVTSCLQGGAQDTELDKIYASWVKTADSPVYIGFMGPTPSLLGTVFAGSSGYAYVKTMFGSDEFADYLKTPALQEAWASRVISLSGSLNRLALKADDTAQQGFRRIMQQALITAADQEVTFVEFTTTLGRFQEMVRKGAWLQPVMAENSNTFGGMVQRGGTGAAGQAMFISDPLLQAKVITVRVSIPEPLNTVKNMLNKNGKFSADTLAASPLRVSQVSLQAEAGNLISTVSEEQLQAVYNERTLRYASGNGVGIALSAIMLALQISDWNKNAESVNDATGNDKDARLTYSINRLMVLSAATEIAGFGHMLTIKNSWEVLPKNYVHPLIRAGGVIAGVAAIVDGVRMGVNARNANKEGDKKAGEAYYKGAIFTALGGFISAGGAYLGLFSLLGPAGIGALLIITGAIYTFEAQQLRSTPFEVWLRRCCFGIPKSQDVVWHAESMDDMKASLAAFNAVVNGMVAEVGFEGLSEIQGQRFTKLELHLNLPGCKEATSAWELSLTGGGSNEMLLAETHNVEGKIDGRRALPASNYCSGGYKRFTTDNGMEIRAEIWVGESRYNTATLQATYWPDKTDLNYKLGLTVNTER